MLAEGVRHPLYKAKPPGGRTSRQRRRDGQVRAADAAEVEVLLPKIAVDVVELHEVKAGRLVATVDEAEVAAVGDDVERPAAYVGERVVEEVEAADDARRAALLVVQHVRPRQCQLAMLLPEARRDPAVAENAVRAQQVVEEEAGGPRRGVREERPVQRELFLVPVGVLRVERIEVPVGPEDDGAEELDRLRAALDTVIEVQLQLAPRPEEVLLRDVEVVRG